MRRVWCVPQGSSRSSSSSATSHHMTLEELRAVNRYAESTKSLSFLPQWFLSPAQEELLRAVDLETSSNTSSRVLRAESIANRSSSGNIVVAGLSASAESVKPSSALVRRSSSRDKSRRGSGRRNKENGREKQQQQQTVSEGGTPVARGGALTEQDCTEMDVQTIHD
ncbi:hypothetical protein B566_EDAN010127 [Ephemera danica]|nr:hypothetical protein B566_EDAN010127 [Ephemera danica]